MTRVFHGILAPLATPFTADLAIDPERYAAFGRELLRAGCHGLVPFGTTGEGPSLSVAERETLLTALIDGGSAPERLLVGTGTSSLPDTVRLTRTAVEAGARGVLLLPPFFFKKIDDDGLIAYVDALIARVGDPRLRLYLYHIPTHAGIGWSPELVARLAARHPDTVVGVKDSGDDVGYTVDVLNRLPGFEAFLGTERRLDRVLDAGGAGAITTTANINAAALRRLWDHWNGEQGQALMAAVCAYRRAVEPFPTVPSTKAVIARQHDDPAWGRVRPPLQPLSEAERTRLFTKLDQLAALAPAPDPDAAT